MRKPSRLLIVAVVVPFMYGCTSALAQPLPEPGARPTTDIRGVILGDPETGERIEYSGTEVVQWSEESVEISGFLRGEGRNMSTRTFQLDDIGAILVHQVDVNRTSLLIGGAMVAVSVLASIFYSGTTTDATILQTGTPGN